MTGSTDPADHDHAASDLVAHARQTHVVVIGGGLAGSVAALECAKVGMTVTLLEAEDRLGGALRPADLGGLAVAPFADGLAPGSGALDGLLDEVGLLDRVERVRPRRRWISGVGTQDRDAVALPEESVLGIPANPWAPDVRRMIGWGGVWRAYLDRLRPPLTIGRERNLGSLVATRMGAKVRDRLVAPVTRATLALEPDEVDVEVVAPKLNAALTSTGSLAGAAGALAAPEPARHSLAGGVHTLIDALADRLDVFEVDVRTGARVERLERGDDGWTVHIASAGDPPETDAEQAPQLHADVVIVAATETDARALLDSVVRLPEAAPPRRVAAVTLRVRMPAPDRSDVYRLTSGGAGEAWRVTDLTAVQPGLAEALPAGERIIRTVGPASQAGDADAVEAARLAASDALARLIAPADVLASARAAYDVAPRGRLGHDDRAAAARAALGRVSHLAVTGAWLAGDGVDRVVADAAAEAARVRREVLWGGTENASL